MQYRTINLYQNTISMTHAPVDGCVIGSHPIVSHFMKGIFQLRMPIPKYLVTWDLSVVLGYLKTLSPRNSLFLKQSTLKLAMLMALISFNRCDSLHKLDLRFHYFKHDGVNFIIPTHTKTSGATKFKEMFFPAFPQDRRLCIINYLKHYKEYTAEYQPKQSPSTPDPLFYQLCHLTSLSHLPHSQGGLKQYLKTLVSTLQRLDPIIQVQLPLQLHRSWEFFVSDILKVADWSREATFIKFYHKPIAPAHPGIQVLSSC